MGESILQAVGGLGLFLLGMRVLTEGLRELSRGASRAALRRFTKSPWSGAATGAALTAVLQSSSATTLAAIGFVGAGLLTFPEALGVVLGANVGTTVTGWLVTLLGFKLPLAELAAPLCFVGMLLRLTDRRGRRGAAGGALAGFGLIFVGIAAMQAGMSGFEGRFGPADLPAAGGLAGRAALVALGLALTAVTQSSSAGVATALAALHTGTIEYAQAAALVVGMDVGTTITSVLGSLGGSANVRRTSAAHVVFNLLTMVGALALLDPWIDLCERLDPGWLAAEPELGLVAFHSAFNVLGAVAVLPFARPFASLVRRLVPERRSSLVAALDASLLDEPPLALDAARRSLVHTARAVLADLERVLRDRAPQLDADELSGALDEVGAYVGGVPREGPDEAGADARRADLVHVLDHVERLGARLRESDRARLAASEPVLAERSRQLSALLAPLGAVDGPPGATAVWGPLADGAGRLVDVLEREEDSLRSALIERAATGVHTPEETLARLDSWRWLVRASVHVARIARHLAPAEAPAPAVGDRPAGP